MCIKHTFLIHVESVFKYSFSKYLIWGTIFFLLHPDSHANNANQANNAIHHIKLMMRLMKPFYVDTVNHDNATNFIILNTLYA